MKIEHKYSGTKKHAYEQIDTLLASLQKQYGDKIDNPSKSWNGAQDNMQFSFGVYGFTLIGTVQIQEKKVIVDGKVPWLAKAFQGKAENLIREKLEEIL
jgi:hypothetical protein